MKKKLRFKKQKRLTTGTYGHIFLAWDTKEKRKVVIKQVKEKYADDLFKEIHFMRAMHRQCPKYFPDIKHVIHQTKNHTIQLIMEYYNWTLTDLIDNDRHNVYLLDVLQQVVEATVILESNLLFHFDLKPDNILVDWIDKTTPIIKVIDFGFMEFYCQDQRSTMICTDYYRPPEIFHSLLNKVKCNYGLEVDLWSIGIILAEYFQKHYVFVGEDDADVEKNINKELDQLKYLEYFTNSIFNGIIVKAF